MATVAPANFTVHDPATRDALRGHLMASANYHAAVEAKQLAFAAKSTDRIYKRNAERAAALKDEATALVRALDAMAVVEKPDDPLTFFGLAGLEYWLTGGGCTAFGRLIDGSPYSLMITDGSGMQHPQGPADTEALLVGIHDHWDEVECVKAVGWQAAIDKANELISKHCPASK